jgi:hypothetical protein
MKKVLLLAAAGIAALAFALPATAGTLNFRGVVIAKDAARKAIVTVSRDGTVRTIRVRGTQKRVQVGRLVAVQAASLPDGTFAASKLRPLGRAGRAHFRANVAAVKGATLALSAGGSVFALRVRGGRAGSATSGGLRPGDRIDAKALVKGGSLQARRNGVKRIGHDDQLELEGIYLDTADDGTIAMAVLHRGRVSVKVPADMTVPDFAPGDEIVAVVTVGTDGSFTLVRAENESSGGDDGGGVNGDGTFSVVGVIGSLSVDRIFVQVEEHQDPVTCAVPAGFDTAGFAVGQAVLMACNYGDGHPVLSKLQHYETSRGAITGLTDEAITIQGDGDPVTCALTDDVDASDFGVGDVVVMSCVEVDGVWTLTAIHLKDPPPPPPPSDNVLVDGPIDALSATAITVDGDAAPVTCAVPQGADLSAFNVDDDVSMTCVHVDGGLRLHRLESDTAVWEG